MDGDTTWARSCFDETTGHILDLKGFKMNWWFCEEVPGKFPRIAKMRECNKASK